MSKRICLLINLAKENVEKNISPNVLSQDHEFQPTIIASSNTSKVPIPENQQTDYLISTIRSNESDFDNSDKDPKQNILLSPSTSKVPIPENPVENHLTDNLISLIQSGESDYDDSDKDPNFELTGNKTKLSKVKVITSSSSSSTSNSSSLSSSSSSFSSSISSSDSSNSNSDDENIDLSQNPTISEVHEQEPEKKKENKRIRKPLMWKTKVAKLLRNSGKAYHSLPKSKKQVPERKLRSPCGNNCRMRCNSNFDESSRPQKDFIQNKNCVSINPCFIIQSI